MAQHTVLYNVVGNDIIQNSKPTLLKHTIYEVYIHYTALPVQKKNTVAARIQKKILKISVRYYLIHCDTLN